MTEKSYRLVIIFTNKDDKREVHWYPSLEAAKEYANARMEEEQDYIQGYFVEDEDTARVCYQRARLVRKEGPINDLF